MNVQKTSTSLWRRWVGANSLGEMLGLGLTFAAGATAITSLGEQENTIAIVLAFIVAVVSGVIEATIVGLAQWWAMNPWFPMIKRDAWWRATLIGALVAYISGYMPSTFISLSEQTTPSQAAPAEPAQWLTMLLAVLLGLVGGAVLSFAQWRVLRRETQGASIWMPANMLAWMVGMPIIFWGIDFSQRLGSLWMVVIFMGIVLLITGSVVGAIHGVFLVRLVKVN